MTDKDNERTPAYLWFDTEFTSLEAADARLLQVALLVTDADLKRLTPAARDVRLYIRLESEAPVSAWVAENLADLVRECRSGDAVSIDEADRRLSALVDEAVGPAAKEIKRRPVLAGNTVHMDMALARRFLPGFAGRLHYRMLDVSTLKILWTDWRAGEAFDKERPGLVQRHMPTGLELPAAAAHDAYFDIHASIAELNYYRQVLNPEETVRSRGRDRGRVPPSALLG